MNLGAYLKDKILPALFFSGALLLLVCFLTITGYPKDSCILLVSLILFIAAVYTATDFIQKKKYFSDLDRLLSELDKPYLVGEVMAPSPHLTDRLYRRIIRISNRSVIEAIHTLESEKKEYQEYIEAWIHEVKAPLTTLNLMCARRLAQEDSDQDFIRKQLSELETLESLVEQTLFYARSDDICHDYLIRENRIDQLVTEAIRKNRRFLTARHMTIEVTIPQSCTAFCDGKWMVFMMSQLLRNCGQYRKAGTCSRILIKAQEEEKMVRLSVWDDGLGISSGELERIFDKGFTGTNGRSAAKSTGMGLYLCQKLCGKLGLAISARSEAGCYTEMILEIPREKTLQICKITDTQSHTPGG